MVEEVFVELDRRRQADEPIRPPVSWDRCLQRSQKLVQRSRQVP